MQQGALLVNAARGPIVETDALVEALQSGRIRAAIDVTDPEPLPEGHPLVELPESADHAAHWRIEPGVYAARAADCGRRTAPLYEGRASAKCGAGGDLGCATGARRQSRRPEYGKHNEARIEQAVILRSL